MRRFVKKITSIIAGPMMYFTLRTNLAFSSREGLKMNLLYKKVRLVVVGKL